MHTAKAAGIDSQRAATLSNTWTWIPPLAVMNDTEELEFCPNAKLAVI
jgi:hypothetical protein